MEGSPGQNLPEMQKEQCFFFFQTHIVHQADLLLKTNKDDTKNKQTKKEKDLREDASLQHSGPPRLHSHVSDVKRLDGKIKVDICHF